MDQKEFTHAWKKDGEDRSGQKTTAIKGYPAADLREELVAFYNIHNPAGNEPKALDPIVIYFAALQKGPRSQLNELLEKKYGVHLDNYKAAGDVREL